MLKFINLSITTIIFSFFFSISFASSFEKSDRNYKTCQKYLSICEKSCKDRGTVFKFQCIGQDFQPSDEHSFCQCADDAFRQPNKKEQISIKRGSVWRN